MKRLILAVLLCLSFNAYSSDRDCLAITIDKEAAAGNIQDGKAVLQVVQNRMRIKGMSACKVVKQHKQFSFVTKDMSWKANKRQLRYLDLLYDVEDSVDRDTIYFHHKRIKWKYAKHKQFVKQIGVHKYYKEKQ